MQETSNSTSSSGANVAIWNPNSAANWSLLFSPAFGSYLHMLNWKALGEAENAAASLKWFYVSIAMLGVNLLLGMLVTNDDDGVVIVQTLGLIVLLSWYFVSARTQAKYVKAKYGIAYSRQPWGKALLFGVGGFIAYLAASIMIGLVLGLAHRAW